MTDSLVNYELNNGVATITMDDGKRNALSPKMLGAIGKAFDRAEKDKAIVILTGREEVFSAGFDLKVMSKGGKGTIDMLNAGYSLTARVLAYPYPVIAAVNGHSLAMGVFLMLSTDYIIGTEGDFKISANEVAIGMPLPRTAESVMRNRLNPGAFQRAGNLAEYFPVEAALQAGFFDVVAKPAGLMAKALEKAEEFAKLDMYYHNVTKQRVRKKLIKRIKRQLPLDLRDALVVGARSVVKAKLK